MMTLILALLLALLQTSGSTNVTLFIGGFYIPSKNVKTIVDLANQAIRDNKTLLQGYDLEIVWKDTKVSLAML